MFSKQTFKPAVILVIIVVAALFGLANCAGGEKPAASATPTPAPSATASAGIAFEQKALAVGDDTGLATMVYALKLSKPDEMIKYAGMYALTSEEFNLVDRYNDAFYKDRVTLLLLVGGPETARFSVKEIDLSGGQLQVQLSEVLKTTNDTATYYRALVVEVAAKDLEGAKTAVVQLHQAIG